MHEPRPQQRNWRISLAGLALAAGLFCGMGVALGGPAPTAIPTEGEAGTVYQLCKLVTWPSEVQSENQLVITVIGKDELSDAVRKLDQAQLGDRVIHVQEVSDPEQSEIAGGVLVIGGDQQQKIPTILESVKGHPILTVGDAGQFASEGGSIEFYQDNYGSLRFHLNKDAFEQAGLTPDPHLLELADRPSSNALAAPDPKLSPATVPAGRGTAHAAATPVPLTPFERKAGAIYQFCRLVTWPSQDPSENQLVITVIGKSELNDAIKELDQALIGSRVIHVKEVTDPDQSELAGGVLVIGGDQEQNLPTILESIKGHPVLTVGDGETFASKGTDIAFYQEGGLRYHVNKDAFEQSGLVIDPHLLELADHQSPAIAKAADKHEHDMPCCRP